jgi:hypothetical protein
VATAVNDSTLVVSLSSTSGETVVWREISFLSSESKRGIEFTLVNPTESYILTLTAKTGSFINVNTDIYIWVAG